MPSHLSESELLKIENDLYELQQRRFVDLPGAVTVEITISADRKRVWIDTEAGNICRIYNMNRLVIRDLADASKETL